ncbi:histidinol-phosphate aminotransferase/imidazoleglycerol-phosphate dehydratase/histidinol-phosphatase [Sphingomonas kaistensis]|uniref:Imidazoleglycerol-phosphate dehydratase n=1 Tax=Sphingomonas kaistensis TaxID=298708 RepID=A0A7X6BGA6_9SPHN|nr:imidazoleglycerol-phosphate dehydratase HisB [Sphingomonas kaistensis]NJC06249.1 histidinol-phosphate aminotransferase/imidazoleglycerol-phosphate dehydratase/histidinol-phosphatase [Sphingomonas kaistensis]
MTLARRLARPEILALEPFDLGNREADPDAIKLDANESPFGPLSGGSIAAGVNRYPEPRPQRLRAAMASLYGVAPAQFLVTRGGDDAIDLLCRTFLRGPGDSIAVTSPSFSAYAHFARLQGAQVLDIPLAVTDFSLDAARVIRELKGDPSAKLLCLCTPNNPTGTAVDPATVLEIVDALPDVMVLADEAYLEFGDAPSLASEAIVRPNLLVLKTLSKAFALAGARVGGLVGPPETLDIIARALPPYPLPTLSIAAALEALQPARRAVHRERIAQLLTERDRIAPLIATSPFVRKVYPSAGNYLFLETGETEQLAARLAADGVRVRYRPQAAPGGIRLTIGTRQENDAALAAFGVYVPQATIRTAEIARDTKETRIALAIDLDRPEPRRIDTGIPYYDHMLDQVAAHGGFSLVLNCRGDLEIDPHHSIEDVAIALGSGLKSALGDKRGIGRFGFALPMDETEAQVLIDLSGRPFSRFEGTFQASHIGDYPTEMTPHVFRSLADSLGAAIHVKVIGENDHHKVEASFKAFGRALRQALAIEGKRDVLPSTKGML